MPRYSARGGPSGWLRVAVGWLSLASRADTLLPMSRRLAPWIVLFALFWHAMAGAVGAWVSDTHHGEHAALHWLEAGHHHDDVGTIQQDDSPASAQHMVADGCSHASCLLPTCAGTMPLGSSQPLPEALAVGLPSPFLDAPRRPPRLLR